MNRTEAIDSISRAELAKLDETRRQELIEDWSPIVPARHDYMNLPLQLRERLTKQEGTEGIEDPENPLYDPLLLIAIRHPFYGVLNSYLEARLKLLGLNETVEGEPDPRYACPCCGYLSLETRSQHEICHVCFWEDDGTDTPEELSGPNHMTLAEGRMNFSRLGAVEEAMLRHVLLDGRERYARTALIPDR